jgi:vancomycin resistance protein VanJ
VRGWDPVFAALRSFDADVIGIVGCDPLDEQMLSRLRREFPDCEVAEFSHSMVLLSRYPITFRRIEMTAALTSAWRAFSLPGRNFSSWWLTSLVVRSIFARGRSNHWEILPLSFVIMGDFNTPIESVFLEPLRDNYLNTIEQGGRGFDCTWPVPCPVLTIDQMWVNQSWKVQSSQLGWTWVSDHRPIVSEISLNPTRQLVAAEMRPAQNL